MPDRLELRGEGDAALTLHALEILPTRIEAKVCWTAEPIPAGSIFHHANRSYTLRHSLEAGFGVVGGGDLYRLDKPVVLEAIRE